MQDDVAPDVAPPKTPESLPVDPRHQKAPKTPPSLSQISKEDIAEALDHEALAEENSEDNEEKDSDIDSDSDEQTCAEASKKPTIKKEPSGQGCVVKPKAGIKKKKTRIQMMCDLTKEDAVDEIVAPVPTKKDAGICQVLESLV